MNSDKLLKVLAIDLDQLPETAIICYIHDGRREVVTVLEARARLVSTQSVVDKRRRERTKHDRSMSRAGALLKGLYRAIDVGDEARVNKFKVDCYSLLGEARTDEKIAAHVERTLAAAATLDKKHAD